MVTKKELLNGFVLFNMRRGRGSSLINQFRIEQYIIIGGAVKIWFPQITVLQIIPIIIVYIVVTYIIGYYDETKLKLWQYELEKNATHVNPYNQRIENYLKRIEDKLK